MPADVGVNIFPPVEEARPAALGVVTMQVV